MSENPTPGTLSFEVSDVTRTRTFEATDVQSTLPAGAVAKSIAASLQLPDNVPWGLRDDVTSRFLEDSKPIGEQIGPSAKVSLTPKTHLG